MKRVVVIGCPGSGKSVFSRELHKITGLPLYPLDRIRWRENRTMIPREEFLEALAKILGGDEWILDGNYDSTMELRMSHCDTIVFLDYPTEVCLDGIAKRRGVPRPDLPWVENKGEEDPAFTDFVARYNEESRPVVLKRIRDFSDREIRIFKSRAEASAYLDGLRAQKSRRKG